MSLDNKVKIDDFLYDEKNAPLINEISNNQLNNVEGNSIKNNDIKISSKELNEFEEKQKSNNKDFKKIEKKNSLSYLIKSEYKRIKTIIKAINSSNDISVIRGLNTKLKYAYKSIHKKIVKSESLSFHDKYSSLDENTIVSLEGVYKYYSSPSLTSRVLRNINLTINKGDFVVILGPSGSGKTSLMNLISGIDKPTIGSVNVAGFKLETLSERELTGFRKDIIGYVFQRYGLLPNLTVYENVLMGCFLGDDSYSQKIYKLQDGYKNSLFSKSHDEIATKVIDVMGLSSQKEKYPYEMSGGQKQRTSIARAIAKNPLIIFGDEPTAAVDEEMSDNIIDAFVKINKDLNTTIIMITHNEKISEFANKVVFILDGKINNVVHKEKGAKL